MIKLAKTSYGNFLGYSNDYLFQILENEQFHDLEIIEFIKNNIKTDSICIDIGANIGAISVPLSKTCKKVYAIEPQDNIFLALCGNLFINECYNVEPLKIAAYSKNAKFSIAPKEKLDGWVGDLENGFDKVGSFGSISIIENDCGLINGNKLDDLIKDKIDFIKVDAEGGDLDALIGCQKIIKENYPKIIFEFNERSSLLCYGKTWENYKDFFVSIEYKIEKLSDSNFLAVKK